MNTFFSLIRLDTLMCSIMNAVRTSGGLRERLFNAAYNAKKQAILSGNLYYQSCRIRFILVFRLSRLFFFVFDILEFISTGIFSSFSALGLNYICIVFGIPPISRGSFYPTIFSETSFTCHHVTHMIESLPRLSTRTSIFTWETKFIVTYNDVGFFSNMRINKLLNCILLSWVPSC